MSGARIVAIGDSALAVQFEARIAPEINAQATTCAAAIAALRTLGVRDVVPAFRSVTVYFDPLTTDVDLLVRVLGDAASASQPEDRTAGHAWVPPSGGPRSDPRTIEIPVCYDPDFGPDLDDVCRVSGLAAAEAIALHAATVYRVYMLGFVPGFAYLGSVDPRIATPRRQVPRTAVARGAVGIAGSQTGVYPRQTAGGWNIIGRTPLAMVSLDAEQPARLAAGDRVRFRPIERAEFDDLLGASS